MANGRTCFVLIPFLLTLATLILAILIFTGNTSTSPVVRDLYFIKANTTGFTLAQEAGLGLADWYTVGLWNYCSGSANSTVANFCSQHQAFFWFDPLKIWGLDSNSPTASAALQLLDPNLSTALNTYQTACKWLFIAYIATIGAAFATLVVSACAFCRRLGSLVTSVVALATTVFAIAAASTATVVYLALVGFIKSKLGADSALNNTGLGGTSTGDGLDASLGTSMFALVWLAAATSLVGCIFFLATACCCAGSSGSGSRKGKGTEMYERVPSPYGHQPVSSGPFPAPVFGQRHYQSVPMHPYHHHESSV